MSVNTLWTLITYYPMGGHLHLTELIHQSANLGSVISVVTKENVIHVWNH